MKRIDLIRHLESHGCVLLREGANHSVYHNLQHNAPALYQDIVRLRTLPQSEFADSLQFPTRFAKWCSAGGIVTAAPPKSSIRFEPARHEGRAPGGDRTASVRHFGSIGTPVALSGIAFAIGLRRWGVAQFR